jgi:teichuronic acid biosynthesis glycosyltransferase TuaC
VRTDCFVIQQLRTSESDIDVPSGTLTVVHQLIKHWDREASKVILLCNRDYGNFSFLEKLRDKYGIQLDTDPIPTVQDRLAKLEYEGTKGAELLLRKSLIRLLAPIVVMRSVLQLRRYFKANNVDVIYSHAGGYPFSNLNVWAVLAGRLAGVRKNFLISHNFSNPISWKRWPFSFVQDRIVGLAATEILSVSEAAAKSIETQRLLGRRVSWIHNGISLREEKEDRAEPMPAWKVDGKQIVMFLGIIAPRKGLDVLMKALAGVHGSWLLVIYGSGSSDYTDSLEVLSQCLGLRDRIIFAGFEPKASKLLRFCDFLVLPSVSYESFGMAILEAMRHKKAVVCSDFGGMKEIVEHGRTGLVVPAGDSARLGEAIQYLLDHPADSRELGLRGYDRLVECFDIETVAKRYAELGE